MSPATIKNMKGGDCNMKANNYSFRKIYKSKKDKLPSSHEKIDSLIYQIQNEYKNEEDVYNLLIAGIKLAQLLDFKDIENWLYLELRGYKNNHKLPDYRKISPEIKAFNPYKGWEPLYVYDQNIANSLKYCSIDLPLPNILELLKHNNQSLEFIFCKEVENILYDYVNYDFSDFKISCIFNSSDFENILNLTKNNILDFTIELQKSDFDSINQKQSDFVINKKINQYFNNNELPRYKIFNTIVEKDE